MTDSIVEELKKLIAAHLPINKDEVAKLSAQDKLFSPEGFSLDSIDMVELAAVLQQKYGIRIENVHENRAVFQTLGSLAEYVEKHRIK